MDKKLILLYLVIFLFLPFWGKCQYAAGVVTSKFNPTGQLEWERHGGLNDVWSNTIYDICSDKNSNVYIAGEAVMSIWFEGNLLPGGLFVAKYSPIGDLLWAKPILGANKTIKGIVADSSGNCYVFGWFNNLIIADTCVIEFSGTSQNVFIIKYDKDGNVGWVKNVLGRDYWIRPKDISINEKYGHLYIIGTEDNLHFKDFNSKLLLAKFDLADGSLLKEVKISKIQTYPSGVGNSGYGVVNNDSSVYICGSMNNGTYADLYVAKLDTGFNVVWEGQTDGSATAYGIVLDEENNVYVTGSFSNTLTLGEQSIVSHYFNHYYDEDLFIAKFSGEGKPIWAKPMGSDGIDIGYSICFDHKNSIYVSGHMGPLGIQTQARGPFFAKLNKNGDFEYAKIFDNGYYLDFRERESGFISCDKEGNLYFATSYVDSIKLGVTPAIREATVGKAYPNPCHSSFKVNLNSQPETSQLTLFNLAGQTVKEINYTNDPVDVSGLPPGIYILNVKSGEQVFREKLMIQ